MRRADLTTFVCRLSWNLGASTSWNPQGLSRPVMGLLYLFLLTSELSHSFRPVLYNQTQRWVNPRNHDYMKMKINVKLLCQESSSVNQFQMNHFTDRVISQNVSGLGLILGRRITHASSRSYLPRHKISLRWDGQSIQHIRRSEKGTRFGCKLGQTRWRDNSR